MSGLLIGLGIPALLMLLLILTPLGAEAGNLNGVLTVKVRVWFIKLTILPSKPSKKKKPKKEKPPKKVKEKKEKPPKKSAFKFGLEDIPTLLEAVRGALGRLTKGITVHRLILQIVCAGQDACATALLYGRINALLSACLPLLHNTLKIKKQKITVDADYSAEQTRVSFDVSLSLRVGTLLLIAIVLLFQFLKMKSSHAPRGVKPNEKARDGSSLN